MPPNVDASVKVTVDGTLRGFSCLDDAIVLYSMLCGLYEISNGGGLREYKCSYELAMVLDDVVQMTPNVFR